MISCLLSWSFQTDAIDLVDIMSRHIPPSKLFSKQFTVCVMRHYFVNDCKSFWIWNRAYLWRRYFARRFNLIVIAEFQILCLIVWSLDLKMAQLMLDLVYFVFSLDDVLVVVRAQLGCLSWWSIGGGGELADDTYNSLAVRRCSLCCRSQKPSNYLHDKRSRTLTRLAGVKWKVGSGR